jgi:hypothetical protein
LSAGLRAVALAPQPFQGLPGDGLGVPVSVVSMNDARLAARGGHSVLSLQFEVVDDGQESFAVAAPGWPGFDLRSAKAVTSQVSGPWHLKGRGALTRSYGS